MLRFAGGLTTYLLEVDIVVTKRFMSLWADIFDRLPDVTVVILYLTTHGVEGIVEILFALSLCARLQTHQPSGNFLSKRQQRWSH
jgi:hypothetical protein